MKNMKKLFASLLLLVGLVSCATTNVNTKDLSANNRLVNEVTLSQSGEIVLEVGETLEVTPTISFKENKEVEVDTKWVSSRPKVASVDNGLVTALSGGSAVITFIAGYKAANFTVTINSAYQEEETKEGLTLNTYSRSLQVGASFQLSATLTGSEEAISYSSENSAVASVNETGLVTGVSEGNTNIVVTAGALSAKCVVVVSSSQEEEEEFDFTVYFFIDYNNIDENDTTGTKLLAKFGWYHNEPIANSGKVPANPTTALDPAFPYFVGWSTHTIIDTKDDLCDLSTYKVENAHFLFIYGIWSDVEVLTK